MTILERTNIAFCFIILGTLILLFFFYEEDKGPMLNPVTLEPLRCVTVDNPDRRIIIVTKECAADWLLDIDGEKKLVGDWIK